MSYSLGTALRLRITATACSYWTCVSSGFAAVAKPGMGWGCTLLKKCQRVDRYFFFSSFQVCPWGKKELCAGKAGFGNRRGALCNSRPLIPVCFLVFYKTLGYWKDAWTKFPPAMFFFSHHSFKIFFTIKCLRTAKCLSKQQDSGQRQSPLLSSSSESFQTEPPLLKLWVPPVSGLEHPEFI